MADTLDRTKVTTEVTALRATLPTTVCDSLAGITVNIKSSTRSRAGEAEIWVEGPFGRIVGFLGPDGQIGGCESRNTKGLEELARKQQR